MTEHPGDRPERPLAPAGRRVLLAEDNTLNQDLLRRLVQALGYTADVVADGQAAVSAAASGAYDVILMDIQMPVVDGETAARAIRAIPGIAQPYIVALTASAVHGDRERYLAAGMDDFLNKPVQIAELRLVLARRASQQPPAPAPEAGGAVDWQRLDVLLASLGGTPEDAAALVLTLFRTSLSGQMADIADAVAAGDRERARALAHKLRGGSLQLAAAQLADRWGALEAAARSGSGPLDGLLREACQSYDETAEQLTRRLAAGG